MACTGVYSGIGGGTGLLNDRFWPCSQYIRRTGVPIGVYNQVEWAKFWPKSSHDFFSTKKDYINNKLSGWVLEAW